MSETESKTGKVKRRRFHFRLWLAIGALVLFAGAFVFYFASSFITTEREYAVYSSMEEPTLPIISATAAGREINVMHGYMQDMGNKAAPDCITPLGENRRLPLTIRLYGNSLAGFSYEVRSLDLEHFIEKTEVTDWTVQEDGTIYTELPIQNMISREIPYLLRMQLDLGERVVNYYTRIIWSDEARFGKMLDTAADFTTRTFDYNEARDLTVYLETDDSADNSTLGTVGIKSNFSQITWGQSGMKLTSDLDIVLKEYDGLMGMVEIRYETESPNESGNPDRYNNTDAFTMRYGAERMYMMNYRRRTNQIFEGNKHLFTGKRINLGITNRDVLQTMKSSNGRYLVFKDDKELWSYDQTGKRAVNIFSFRSENDRLRAGYDQHDIKILSVSDTGNIDFVVYGYMNRGRHEGNNGIVYYQYDSSSATISEIFFIPAVNTYEKIKLELDELCMNSGSGMVYLKQNDAVLGIDLTSLEMLDVAAGLSEGCYAVSGDQSRIAWLEGDRYGENSIKLMDLGSASSQVVSSGEGASLRVVAFYNQDLIYGVSRVEDRWMLHNRMKGLPLTRLMIVDTALQPIMEYEKPGLVLDNISVEGDRIHLTRYQKGSRLHTFRFQSRDTIVSSEPEEDLYTRYISRGDTETKKQVFYIDLDENIKTTKSLKVAAPKNISYERSGNVELAEHRMQENVVFFAYGNGRLKGRTTSLSDAADLCYDDMGWVTDQNAVVVYNRTDRTSSKTISEPNSAAQPMVMELADFKGNTVTDDGWILLDGQGMELNRLMYYIYKGCPVLAFLDDKNFCLLCGYDSKTIKLYYPGAEDDLSRVESMEMEDAAAYFASLQNDYICFLPYVGK